MNFKRIIDTAKKAVAPVGISLGLLVGGCGNTNYIPLFAPSQISFEQQNVLRLRREEVMKKIRGEELGRGQFRDIYYAADYDNDGVRDIAHSKVTNAGIYSFADPNDSYEYNVLLSSQNFNIEYVFSGKHLESTTDNETYTQNNAYYYFSNKDSGIMPIIIPKKR